MFYSSIGAEILRIARAINNSDCVSLSIKPLVIRMLKQGACKEKLNNVLCTFFNKHHNDFQYVVRTTQELLALIFRTQSSHSGQSITSIAIAMQIKR